MGVGGGCDVGEKHIESLCVVVEVFACSDILHICKRLEFESCCDDGKIFFLQLALDAFRLYCSLGYGTPKTCIILYSSCDSGCGIRYACELKVPCIVIFV